MSEPLWLRVADIIALHDEQLAIFGGPEGLRDLALLESAAARPQNRWSYGETGIARLAGSLAFGIAKNHPFVDGNKRTAFAAMMVFIRVNGIRFAPDPAEATAAMLALASSDIDEEGFVQWLEDKWPRG